MAFDYFYGAQSQQFAFYRIPKVLFTDPGFKQTTGDAKILYGLMLDRMGLSIRNGWQWKTAGLMMREECISFSP